MCVLLFYFFQWIHEWLTHHANYYLVHRNLCIPPAEPAKEKTFLLNAKHHCDPCKLKDGEMKLIS